ncbi:hypothetical protein Hanom_Chr00s025380g01764421 [Helianthus anomalus]
MEAEDTPANPIGVSGSPNSFDDDVKAINQGKQQDVPCYRPSRSPCTTNLMPSDIPTPTKQLNFDAKVNTEVEGGWVIYRGGGGGGGGLFLDFL